VPVFETSKFSSSECIENYIFFAESRENSTKSQVFERLFWFFTEKVCFVICCFENNVYNYNCRSKSIGLMQNRPQFLSITATGGARAAGIGGGYENGDCGTITIKSTVTSVIAMKGNNNAQSIGKGEDGKTISVTIEAGANVTQN